MASRLAILLCLLLNVRLGAQDIFEAARKGDTLRMAVLAREKPDTLNSINENGFTPLIIAAYREQARAVEFLLQRKVKVNSTSPEGTALLAASFKGNNKIASLLLDGGADIDAQNAEGVTALMFAVQSDNPALAELLLKRGAKKDVRDKSGKTAADHAVSGKSKKMMDLFAH